MTSSSNAGENAIVAWIMAGVVIMLILTWIWGGTCGYKWGLEQGYKNGQTDALNGRWQFRLVDAKAVEAVPAK